MDGRQIWKEALLPQTATIGEAIRNLERTGLRIVLATNSAGSLFGSVSDGDIRRGLLKGLDLEAPISSIAHQSPLVVPQGLDRTAVVQLMIANKVQQVPVVNENKVVTGLHVWDEINAPVNRENIMVIMAGGMGKRLRPQTENCPKPMLPVAGKPMLEHILERAKNFGFKRFAITLYHLGEMVEGYFGDGHKWDVHIDYLREDEPMGTAGGLKLLQSLEMGQQPFVVTNGDVLTDINYGGLLDFHIRQEAMATMAVRLYEWQHPYGVVQIDGTNIVGFEEKPISKTHINAGVYAIEWSALSHLPQGRCDMPGLFEILKQQGGRTVAYPMHEPWLDVGRPSDLKKAQSNASQTSE
jgi:dTDP-glucose pyrophosphorylase